MFERMLNMKYDAWRRSKKIQEEFKTTLYKLTDLFQKIANSAGEDKEKYTRDMNEFQNSEQYTNFIYSAVKRMVTPLAVNNYSTWRRAAKKANRSPYLYTLLMRELNTGIGMDINQQIEENADLIRTLPSDTAHKVVKDIEEMAFKGMRASDIAKIIQDKTKQHSRASARLIARTEVSKTTTALTKARCNNLDIHWYVWRTAEDGNRVRKSHRVMNGVLVNWNDPPSPERLAGEKDVGNYHAGNIWNCRCYPEPLLEIDDVHWPHKVYWGGQIKTMTKGEFEQLL